MQNAKIKDLIKTYDGCLTVDQCSSLIDFFNQHSNKHIVNGAVAGPGLSESAWTELNLGKLFSQDQINLFVANINKYKKRYEVDCGLPELPAARRYAELIHKRYKPSSKEKFQPHFDSLREVSNRYLVFLWYLNDVSVGGETTFTELGVNIKPKAGRLLIFPPYWMYIHAGLPPISNEKHIISTYFLW